MNPLIPIQNIAISGVSGRFAKSENVEEFTKNLFDKVDMVSDHHTRWNCKAMKTPASLGIIPNLKSFDANFFGMNPKQVANTDHRCRKLLEVVFECFVDAGINPAELRGSRTGVFLGVLADDNFCKTGVNFLNRAPSLMANLVSYIYDLKGPSLALDTGCSSSLYALNQAVDSIRLGVCDSAIVCGSHTNLTPAESILLSELQVLNPEGRCKTFDADRNGYVKSDAVVAVLLQKTEDCRRIYGTIAGIGSNVDGYKEDGLMHPSSEWQMKLFKEVHDTFKINPSDVVYVECHGTGTLVGDVEEASSIFNYFCKKRSTPVLVGSVKSNAGHSENASGLVALVKVLISIHTGRIPANLHFNTPGIDIAGLLDGAIKVVDEHTSLAEGLVAINSFGFGGTNSHVVIKPYLQKQTLQAQPTSKQTLIFASGRTKESLQETLDKIIAHKSNPEFLLMVNEVFGKPILNHQYRGYAILSDQPESEINICNSIEKEIWFVYSGMGSQWLGMANDLIHFKVFREAIKKCAQALKPYNMDLEDIILNGTEETFDNITNCFTSLIAMSIGLTDLLKFFGLVPDKVIGHSFGEVGCAYADGHITAEQAVLIGYGRGLATRTSDLIPGAMAAIGMRLEDCEKLLPSDIFVASRNSEDNLTISGPVNSVKEFIAKLQSLGIFTKLINTNNYAFHSPYMHGAGQKFLDFLKENVIKERTPRKKWLSSAIPEAEWGSELGRNNSAEYFYHNFINQVNFIQVLKRVPPNAIVVEISPKGLMQAVLRRSLEPSVKKISLLSDLHEDNMAFFLAGIGKIYLAGAQPNVDFMYQPKNFPVSHGTPMLSTLVSWDHSTEYAIPKFNPEFNFGMVIEIDMNKKENKFFINHIIDGKNIFPIAGYMVTVWNAFACMLEKATEELAVVFEDIRILDATFFNYKSVLAFLVNITKTTGDFSISKSGTILATGKIRVPTDPSAEYLDYSYLEEPNKFEHKLSGTDFYKELHLRGYDYQGTFQGVVECDMNGRTAKLKCDNYVLIIDAIMQNIVYHDSKTLYLPTNISKLVIDPQLHCKSFDDKGQLEYQYNEFMATARSGGVEIRNLLGKHVKPQPVRQNVMKYNYKFVPYNLQDHKITDETAISFSLTNIIPLVIENRANSTTRLNILQVNSTRTKCVVNYEEIISEVVHPRYGNTISFTMVEKCTEDAKLTDLVIVLNILQEHEDLLENFNIYFNPKTFIFTNISGRIDEAHLKIHKFSIVFKYDIGDKQFVLIRKVPNAPKNYTIIQTRNDNYYWLDKLKSAIKEHLKIYLVTNEEYSGVVGLFNGLQQENRSAEVRVYNVQDLDKEEFSMDSAFYKEQIEKDLTINIFSGGNWGSYRLLPQANKIEVPVKSAFLHMNVNKVEWIEDYPICAKSKVMVQYSGLSYWDSQIYNKKIVNLSKDVCLGFEYSGVDADGSKIMGLSKNGTFRTHLVPHPMLTWKVPNRLNLEEAATIPLAYSLSYYALVCKGSLKPSSRIFIPHSENPINQAIIILAISMNCEVFLEVPTLMEQAEVLDLVPELSIKNIIVAKDRVRTIELLMQRTKGEGVNILVNTSNQIIEKNLVQVLNKEGKLVNISYDHSNQDLIDLGTNCIIKSCVLHNVTILNLFNAALSELETVQQFVQASLHNGTIKPLKYQTKGDLSEILSLLETSSSNRIVVDQSALWSQRQIYAKRRTYFDPNKSYIIVGGLGGFGLELCDWMLARGANKIILNSRSNIKNGYQAFCLKKWRNNSHIVLINNNDTIKFEGAEALIYQAASLGEIGGIFNVAMVLENKLLDDLTIAEFEAVVAPKLYSAMHLDKLSRKLCHNLDHFVLFSSVVSSLGISGQTNYAYANSAMERLCESRRKDNLPGKAIEYGPIADVGYVSRINLRTKILGTTPQRIACCLEVLDEFLQNDCVVFSNFVFNKEDDVQDAKDVTQKSVVDLVASTFCFEDGDVINYSATLLNLGMDSLMGMEIKNILFEKLDLDISVNEIRNLTLDDVKGMEISFKRRTA